MISGTSSARRRRRLGILAVSIGVLGALLAPPIEQAEAVVVINPLKIVLIGDSYAAGNGARDADGGPNYAGPSGCYRSPTNWAAQYVGWLGSEGFQVTFVNRACSGAVIRQYSERKFMGERVVLVAAPADTPPEEVERIGLAGPCRTRYPGDEVYIAEYQFYNLDGHGVLCRRFMEPQTNAIGEDTDLVLITGGGNDVDFAEIVKQCFAPFLRDPGACREQINNALDELANVENRMVDTLAAIRARVRPDTRVALVGYPFLANNDDFELVYRRFGIWESDRYAAAREVRELGRLGDLGQQAAVDRANAAAGEDFATFVSDVKQYFAGHEPKPELGAGNPDRWMNEFEQLVFAENYHYNAEVTVSSEYCCDSMRRSERSAWEQTHPRVSTWHS